jgi:hypothetical protein
MNLRHLLHSSISSPCKSERQTQLLHNTRTIQANTTLYSLFSIRDVLLQINEIIHQICLLTPLTFALCLLG